MKSEFKFEPPIEVQSQRIKIAPCRPAEKRVTAKQRKR